MEGGEEEAEGDGGGVREKGFIRHIHYKSFTNPRGYFNYQLRFNL